MTGLMLMSVDRLARLHGEGLVGRILRGLFGIQVRSPESRVFRLVKWELEKGK
jgi:hypothetical protein